MKKLTALFLACACLLSACGSIDGISASESAKDSFESFENSSYSSEDSSASSQDENHKDGNDDGVCDDCNASVLMELDFIAVNDLHGKFVDSDANEGVDELSTYIKQTRQSNANTVLLSSGDMWQGSSESNLTKGNIITEWMNEMDFVSMTLGNHEYDWGEEYIIANEELAEFPFLAINVYDRDTDKLVEYCQPSVTVELDGATIGVIGAIGDCYSSISGDKSQGVYFKTDDELTSLVKAEANRLRNSGADFIVYSIHDGYGSSSTPSNVNSLGYYNSVLSEGFVDLVFEGHSHQSYAFKDGKGVYHMQGGGDNDGISHAKVTLNFANGNSKVNEANFVAIGSYSHLADDPVVDELMGKYGEQIAIAGKVLGQNDKFRDGSEILSTCAQLYYEAGVEKWGDEYDIVLGGGYMSIRSPYYLQTGTIIYGDLQNILPFDNQLVLCSIKGADLRSKFFETSNRNYYIAYGDYGADVRLNLDLSATYYIVTDSYSSTYKPNNLTEIERYDETTFARDLLAKYIEKGGFGLPVAPEDVTYTSIPTVHAIGNALPENGETVELYYVKAKIKAIHSAKYGNVTLVDEDGNTVYVYGIYDKDGTRYDGITNPPQVGDTVVLRAPIKKYVNNGTTTIELFEATLWSIE